MSRRRLLAIAPIAVLAVFVLRAGGPERWPIRNPRAGDGPIVCFGDSLTAGFGAAAEESYPAVLARLLGREVVNRGRNGDTSESALERLEEDVLALRPGAVVITLGGNDMIRRLPIDATVRSLREIFERSIDAGALVVFVPIDPPFVGDERMRRVRELCRETGVVWAGSVMDGLWGDRRLMSDRIHPNAAGYRLVAERVREVLASRL